jgi:hypothetical protein
MQEKELVQEKSKPELEILTERFNLQNRIMVDRIEFIRQKTEKLGGFRYEPELDERVMAENKEPREDNLVNSILFEIETLETLNERLRIIQNNLQRII